MRIAPQRLALLFIITFLLTGCFRSAGDAVEPTTADLTSIAPVALLTPTPFITPISTGGFVTPTTDPNEPTATTTLDDSLLTLPTNAPASETPLVTAPVITDTPVPTATGMLDTPTPLPSEGPCVHTVQPGEWLYSIARKYNVNPDDLVAANPSIPDPNNLNPGDVLNLPGCNAAGTPNPVTPTTSTVGPSPTFTATIDPNATQVPLSDRLYTVAPGDSLGAIARKFGVTVESLRAANNLTSDRLSIGQVLKIPKPPTPTP